MRREGFCRFELEVGHCLLALTCKNLTAKGNDGLTLDSRECPVLGYVFPYYCTEYGYGVLVPVS